MRTLTIFLFCFSALAQTPQAINLTSAQFLSYTYPSGLEGNRRVEFREVPPALTGTFYIGHDERMVSTLNAAGTSVTVTDGYDSVSISVGVQPDFRCRAMRDIGAARFSLQCWSGSGANYTVATIAIPGAIAVTPGSRTAWINANFGASNSAVVGGAATKVGFYRTYSTVVPLDSPPPAEAPTIAGDVGDFRFETSLADSGSATLTLTLEGGGSAAYAANVVSAPVSAITTPTGSRATVIASLSSVAFSSLLGNGVPTLFWTQTAGPAQGTFSSRTSSAPTFTAPMTGAYTIQLTATDAAGTRGTSTASLASIATDDQDEVITGLSPVMNKLLGRVTRSGTEPWPYYGIAEKAVAEVNAVYALAHLPTLGARIVGDGACTVQITEAPTTLIGNGHCRFLTDLTDGADCTTVSSTSCPVVGWTTVDGADTGRYECPIDSRTNDNLANCHYYNNRVTLGSGYKIYLTGAGMSPGDPWMCQGNSANNACVTYYDTTLALYRLYYRTGNTQYLTWARAYADNWWAWGFDHGAGLPFPRALNMLSQTFRALELLAAGGTNRFPGLYISMNWYSNLDNFNTPGYDNREAGYQEAFEGVMSIADADPTRHAQYCTWLKAHTPAWYNSITVKDYVPNNLFVNGYPYTTPMTAPWQGVFGAYGMYWAYQATKDPTDTACYDATISAAAKAAVPRLARGMYNIGVAQVALGGNRGVYFDVDSLSNGQVGVTTGAGTVSASTTSNPTIIVGSGTNFTGSICAGSKYIGIIGGGLNGVNDQVYRIVSCSDTTHATIASAWGLKGESTVTGVTYVLADAQSTNCASATAATCWNDIGTVPAGDRNLTRTMIGIMGVAYNEEIGCGEECKTFGDELFSSTFGGPDDGPGGLIHCTSPGCDNTETDYTTTLPVPQGAGSSPVNAKPFGEGSGFPAAATYLAERLGPALPAVPRSVYVSGCPAAIIACAKTRLLVQLPDGSSSTSTCTVTSCLLTIDARYRAFLLTKSYLTSSNTTIVTADVLSVKIR